MTYGVYLTATSSQHAYAPGDIAQDHTHELTEQEQQKA